MDIQATASLEKLMMSNVQEKVVCKCKFGADCVCFHSGSGPVHLTGAVYQGKCYFFL